MALKSSLGSSGTSSYYDRIRIWERDYKNIDGSRGAWMEVQGNLEIQVEYETYSGFNESIYSFDGSVHRPRPMMEQTLKMNVTAHGYRVGYLKDRGVGKIQIGDHAAIPVKPEDVAVVSPTDLKKEEIVSVQLTREEYDFVVRLLSRVEPKNARSRLALAKTQLVFNLAGEMKGWSKNTKEVGLNADNG